MKRSSRERSHFLSNLSTGLQNSFSSGSVRPRLAAFYGTPVHSVSDYHETGKDGSVHYVELREEAIKSWEHFQSDDLVYLGNAINGLSNTGFVPAEGYLDGRFWLELQFVLTRERDANYVAIIRCFSDDVGFANPIEHSAQNGGITRNSSVLVEVTYLVKPPQRVTFKSVPSMVWLKRLNLTDGSVRDTRELPLESVTSFAVPHLDDRKLDVPRGYSPETRQSPHGLVEGRSQTVKDITSDQSNLRRNIVERNLYNVLLMFYVVIAGNGIGLRWRIAEGQEFPFESFEVRLRPTQLRVGIGQARHK